MGVSGKPRTESFCFKLGLRYTDSFEVEVYADDGAEFNSFIALVVLVVVVFTFSLKGVAMLEYG